MQIATCSNLISAYYNIKHHCLLKPQPILVIHFEYKDESCNNQLCGMKTHGVIKILVEHGCYYLF